MSYEVPTVEDFKLQFDRDFPFGVAEDTVKDSDISKAQMNASFGMNEGLFGVESEYQFLYNILTAHYLVMNLKSSSQGLSGTFSWLEGSKSVGSVSQSFSIPQTVSENPLFATLGKTGYGVQYLTILLPLTYGGMTSVEGATIG